MLQDPPQLPCTGNCAGGFGPYSQVAPARRLQDLLRLAQLLRLAAAVAPARRVLLDPLRLAQLLALAVAQAASARTARSRWNSS